MVALILILILTVYVIHKRNSSTYFAQVNESQSGLGFRGFGVFGFWVLGFGSKKTTGDERLAGGSPAVRRLTVREEKDASLTRPSK